MWTEPAPWWMEQGLARPDGPRATEDISKHSASFFQAPRSWTSRQMNSANGLPKSIVCKNLSGLQTLPWSPSHSSMPLSLSACAPPSASPQPPALLGGQDRPGGRGLAGHFTAANMGTCEMIPEASGKKD